MAVKGIHERRHQRDRAKARTLRKLKVWRWFRTWDGGERYTEEEMKKVVGRHATTRRRCSCYMCKTGKWHEEAGSGLRAVAKAEYQEEE